MSRNVVLAILIVLALIAGAAGIGYYAYTTGYAQGLTQSGKIELVVPNPEDGAVRPFMYGAPGFHYFGGWGLWGGPFGFLRCLLPLLFFLLVFGLLRFLIWRPWGWRHRWGGYGGYGGSGEKEGLPPMFEEWHKRAHEPKSAPPSE